MRRVRSLARARDTGRTNHGSWRRVICPCRSQANPAIPRPQPNREMRQRPGASLNPRIWGTPSGSVRGRWIALHACWDDAQADRRRTVVAHAAHGRGLTWGHPRFVVSPPPSTRDLRRVYLCRNLRRRAHDEPVAVADGQQTLSGSGVRVDEFGVSTDGTEDDSGVVVVGGVAGLHVCAHPRTVSHLGGATHRPNWHVGLDERPRFGSVGCKRVSRASTGAWMRLLSEFGPPVKSRQTNSMCRCDKPGVRGTELLPVPQPPGEPAADAEGGRLPSRLVMPRMP